ncbi:MAG TPA: sirohydrochlorin cobaltochelatase [Candidatus Faecalibacterium avium]|mgnify:CR=1 FL=1|uniref:sirohydrochlorin cobaltochelatase n=1 Tax=unclassified Faecalibacterium TaxID=2646395 RepID=UPI000B373611|nr:MULTISPECIES: sirohydrochlorin cobaltochelatase [unclassified Faecalibacterium]OUN74986.1 hypothetical protein B5G12_04245 [Faecalibacterium sp. An58]OUQ38891.1 hypothetical protein B5E66_05785 [Faecalibacterium sp. An121]HIV44453.1 sirohydrochlorin cobaltochelatase [Candidatus Faecalibacterium avium]
MQTTQKALVCASFGTTVPTAAADIAGVEQALAAAAPGWQLLRAYTSGMVRTALAGRGQPEDSVPEALARAAAAGCRRVLVQPTHFLWGVEYDKLKAQALAAAPGFDWLRVGRPLLDDTRDLRALAGAIGALYPAEPGRAVVLMGHGSAHRANVVYPALQGIFELQSRPDIRVGTVEGWPGLAEVCAALARSRASRVLLVPLMLVAGDHAQNDMAGPGPHSWRSVLAGQGYRVDWVRHGLGSEKAVQDLYAAHLRGVLQEDGAHGL